MNQVPGKHRGTGWGAGARGLGAASGSAAHPGAAASGIPTRAGGRARAGPAAPAPALPGQVQELGPGAGVRQGRGDTHGHTRSPVPTAPAEGTGNDGTREGSTGRAPSPGSPCPGTFQAPPGGRPEPCSASGHRERDPPPRPRRAPGREGGGRRSRHRWGRWRDLGGDGRNTSKGGQGHPQRPRAPGPPPCPLLLCHSQDRGGQARQCADSPSRLSPARGSAGLGKHEWAHGHTWTRL